MNIFGCLSNQTDQSQRGNLRNEPKQSKTREQTAIACLNRPIDNHAYSAFDNSKSTMDAHTIDNLERNDPSAETRNLIARWRDIVKPGVHRISGGRWKNTTNRDSFEMKEKSLRSNSKSQLEIYKMVK